MGQGKVSSFDCISFNTNGGFSGSRFFSDGPATTMAEKSINYLVTSEGVKTRRPGHIVDTVISDYDQTQRYTLWGIIRSYVEYEEQVWVNSGDHILWYEHRSIGLQVSDIYFGASKVLIVNYTEGIGQSYIICFWRVYRNPSLNADTFVFEWIGYTWAEPWDNLATQLQLDAWGVPNVNVIYNVIMDRETPDRYKECYIITFPNFPNIRPLFFWALSSSNTWDKFDFNLPAEYPQPTNCVEFRIAKSNANCLVWGMGADNYLYYSSPIIESTFLVPSNVKKLLSISEEDNCGTISLGSKDSFTRAMINYNDGLFIFGDNTTLIVSNICTLADDGTTINLDPSIKEAPFIGGAYSQQSVCKAWNDVYVGSKDGKIYSIQRVIQSGNYALADFSSNIGFPRLLFKGFITADYRWKFLQLFYSTPDDAVFIIAKYWEEVFDDQGVGQWVENTYGLAYRDGIQGSTGWSRIQVDPDTVLGATDFGYYIYDVNDIDNMFFFGELPSLFFYDGAVTKDYYRWDHIYQTPFFSSGKRDIKYLFRKIRLLAARNDDNPIYLQLVARTKEDGNFISKNTLLPRYFVFGEGVLNRESYAANIGVLSWLLGQEGEMLQFEINADAYYQNNNGEWLATGDHIISGFMISQKEIGGSAEEGEPMYPITEWIGNNGWV